ncbi:branched-chain amino acid transaminase [Candidatus Marsarchaeota archaeon]|nr:branched-chain amino acid transaminase [Candidatus Marsarchaeota archaeon]MCL5099646.1 branched-chain amino acid transaminase [Candidatus Marsarchaeota archaeon]
MAENIKGRMVWLDGKIVSYEEAKVPILTHSLQYGSGIFEGIRAYQTKKGAAIFRLPEHVKRFQHSAKIYSMELGRSDGELSRAIIDTVKANGLDSCYIRPFAFYNDDKIGMSTTGKKISVYIAAVPFGAYFGAAKERGIRCKVSSWRRINSDILPVEAKASGNYINSIMANNEARASGFDEAILLSSNGYVAEGPGENIFIVKDGELITPGISSDILLGITRDSLIEIADKLGINVAQRELHHEELYTADEAFFAGTAAEITPIVNIDGMGIGEGKPGRITMMLSKKYDSIVRGNEKAYARWLTYVK